MAETLISRRVAFSQRVIHWLVGINFLLIAAHGALAQNLSPGSSIIIPGLLVAYNVLLSWLVILRARRRSDRALLYAMLIGLLLLGVSLFRHLLV